MIAIPGPDGTLTRTVKGWTILFTGVCPATPRGAMTARTTLTGRDQIDSAEATTRPPSHSQKLRRLWILVASISGTILLVVAVATLLRFGRLEWIAQPAPISVWNNQATEIEITLVGNQGSATYTSAPHGLVTLRVPASIGEPTSLREGALGSNGCASEYHEGFGSLREGTLMAFGDLPNGQHGCESVSGPVDGLEIIPPDAGS